MKNIQSILANQCALQKERPIIVGVSGGADSLCLMDILREAGYKIIVAHFDHQLRDESNQDAKMVQETCARLSLECVVESANVRAYANEKKFSIEEAARESRYRFMFNLARQKNAQAVAVGHTADDQVETVLMHILRGSSLDGLKGMAHRAIVKTFDGQIPIARPLLDMKRGETIAYCAAHHLHPQFDASNDSLEYRRNKIRHQLIPALETYNPKIKEALLRMSQTLKDDSDLLDSLADVAWRDCATPQIGFVAFDISLLVKYAAGLQRRLIKRAMLTLCPNIDVDFAALNRAVNVVARSDGDEAISNTPRGASRSARNNGLRVDLKSGLYMFRESNQVYVCMKDADLPLNLFPQIPVIARSDSDEAISNTSRRLPRSARNDVMEVLIPSTIELANGWTLTVARAENIEAREIKQNENPFEAWFDADTLGESLEARKYRRGDRFIPLGMDGHSQKLSDLFVNEKIPRRARENWAVLCSGENIIWAAGIHAAHFCRVTDSTKNIIRVSLCSPNRESTSAI
ncbi:MAG: tRNA lysidine(34) synthetase TilS [Anaerolineales bacterium]|nr:tRNA lysidine(34) synthetase TilS [Anaerolineales bacterium]